MQFAERCYLPFLEKKVYTIGSWKPTCPDAMMVHLHDAADILSDIDLLKAFQHILDLPFAGLAVMSTRRFGHFTFPTIPLS
jgi:hypothetical protein